MKTTEPELIIVMPVFNEQASLQKVVVEWFQEIENWTNRFVFLAIDDGSNDESLKVLQRLQIQFGERLEVISRSNRGHGQSCLQGYREAILRRIPWVLQIDSDGQCDPQYFFRIWQMRDHYDVIYGVRQVRDDGPRRVMASLVLKLTLVLFCGVWCADANVPYRLMRTEGLRDFVEKIPTEFDLANVGLAVLLKRKPQLREGRIKIRFRERYGGEPNVPLLKFSHKAAELVRQLRALLQKEI